MTITLTGHFGGRRAPTFDTTEPLSSAAPVPDEPAMCSLGTTFDDTAWAASIGCRPLFADRPR